MEMKAQIHFQVFDASENLLVEKEVHKPLAQGITSYLSEEINMSGLTGSFQARVKLKDKKGNLIAKNSFDFDIFDPVVFDSDAEMEFQETVNKSKALIKAAKDSIHFFGD